MPVYFITYSVLFWLPAVLLYVFLFKTLTAALGRSFWSACCLMALVSTVMEYLYIYFDVWSFSERTDSLLGLRLWSVPVEEFVFWFGATPFCLMMYLGYRRLFRRKNA
ncbi:MAG: hypothetical protein WCW52_08760 [Elusimicrobiales bacterium]|jgi:lycopene cyclase domain-containing protein